MKRFRKTIFAAFASCFAIMALSAAVAFVALKDKTTYDESLDLKQTMANSTVSIFQYGRGIGSCSGVIIRQSEAVTFVLTAKHCIGPVDEFYVDHNKVALTVTSALDDLALLVVDKPIYGKVPVKMGTYPALINQKVHHMGYPAGYPSIEPFVSSGHIARNTEDWQWVTMESQGGCSGGPIFNEQGELVGILWGGYTIKGNDITIIEPLQDVMRFLKEVSYLMR